MPVGCCEGGPLDGRTADSASPLGFVLVDDHGAQAWIYDRGGPGWRVRDPLPSPAADLARAAANSGYDVLAAVEATAGGVVADPWDVDPQRWAGTEPIERD